MVASAKLPPDLTANATLQFLMVLVPSTIFVVATLDQVLVSALPMVELVVDPLEDPVTDSSNASKHTMRTEGLSIPTLSYHSSIRVRSYCTFLMLGSIIRVGAPLHAHYYITDNTLRKRDNRMVRLYIQQLPY